MNRKTLISFFAIIMLVISLFLFSSCGEDELNENTQPTIKPISDITLDVGDERTVEVNITDADVEDIHTISATSDDTTVATVSVDGATLTITGKAAGTAAITVTATDDSGQDNAEATPLTFRVGVKKNSQPVIEAIPDQILDVGDEITVAVNITDADVEDTHIISASSDDKAITTVAVNNTTLTITGIADGMATINVSATDNSRQGNALATSITFQVTVVGCQIPPLDEDYKGVPVVFAARDFTCVLLSDGNLTAFACANDGALRAVGGPVLTPNEALVQFAGVDVLNEFDGKLTEFEVGKTFVGTIELRANRFRFIINVPKQNADTIEGDNRIVGLFTEGVASCLVDPNLESDVVVVLTGIAKDLLAIMRRHQ